MIQIVGSHKMATRRCVNNLIVSGGLHGSAESQRKKAVEIHSLSTMYLEERMPEVRIHKDVGVTWRHIEGEIAKKMQHAWPPCSVQLIRYMHVVAELGQSATAFCLLGYLVDPIYSIDINARVADMI